MRVAGGRILKICSFFWTLGLGWIEHANNEKANRFSWSTAVGNTVGLKLVFTTHWTLHDLASWTKNSSQFSIALYPHNNTKILSGFLCSWVKCLLCETWIKPPFSLSNLTYLGFKCVVQRGVSLRLHKLLDTLSLDLGSVVCYLLLRYLLGISIIFYMIFIKHCIR